MSDVTRADASLNVQYGCGTSAPDSWINFDASPTLRLQKFPVVGALLTRGRPQFPVSIRYGDVVTGLPVGSGTCQRAYCSHVLEHLSLDDCRLALRETHRILKPGGTFRGVLPDLERVARAYVNDLEAGAAVRFMEGTMLGIKQRPRGAVGLATAAIGNSHHLWMWDYKALAAELATAGFRDIRPAQFGDSRDPIFAAVEEKVRWDDNLGFECQK
jgi:Methyltransferase domain